MVILHEKKYYMNCLRVSNIFTNVFKAILKFVSIFKFGWLFGNTQISSNIIASCVWRMSIPLHRFLFIIQSCNKFRTYIYAHYQTKVKILMIDIHDWGRHNCFFLQMRNATDIPKLLQISYFVG